MVTLGIDPAGRVLEREPSPARVTVAIDAPGGAPTLEDVCGIAGFALDPRSRLNRTLVAQVLLAGIAERGADAVGYAHRSLGQAAAVVVKQRTPASELLDRISVPSAATELLLHVRDHTKGHPSIPANNHPVLHGPVVGVHNGVILNDDDLLAEHECARTEPGMVVDSEAIFALAAHSRSDPRALESLQGAMAAAWLDERQPDALHLARGVARPLWLGEGGQGVFFASTEHALRLLERYCVPRLRRREVREGTLVALVRGRVARQARFRTQDYVETAPLPAVRAPRERDYCLTQLAAITASW
jgi:glutamine phosphoribosylpyrophosphate amidotransferase